MPTILRQDGFEVMIYTRDHEPPHVHVWHAGTELVINLDPLAIRENNRMLPNNSRKAFDIVAYNQTDLLIAWRRLHP